MFENMIQNKLQKSFIVKKFFKSKDDFISVLKEVEEISFTEANELFNQDSKKRKALIDLTGTDAPEKFTLTTKYSEDSAINNFILNLINSKQKSELNNLVIKGVDNDNFGFVFNVDSFVQKIFISLNKESNGKYNPYFIKEELLKRIYNDEK